MIGIKKDTEEVIFAFEEMLSHKLFLLDTPAHAGITDQPKAYLPVDVFLYPRCAVVAKGKDCFNQTVKIEDIQFNNQLTRDPLSEEETQTAFILRK